MGLIGKCQRAKRDRWTVAWAKGWGRYDYQEFREAKKLEAFLRRLVRGRIRFIRIRKER